MIPLHSIAASEVELVANGLWVVCSVLLVLAFMVGFGKGFRKIGWKGVACLSALGIFVLARYVLNQYNYAIDTREMPYGEDYQAWTAVIVMFETVAIALVLYGLCTSLFRPRSKWVTSNPTYLKDGLEYEDDSGEVLGETRSRLIWKNAGTPTIWGRLAGGVLAAVNMAAVLFALISVAFLVLKVPYIAEMESVAAFMGVESIQFFSPYVYTYGADYLCVSILFLVANKGYRRGFLYSIFSVLKVLGGLLVLAVSFYLPFSPFVAEDGMLAVLLPYVEMLGGWVTAIPFVGTMEGAVDIVGRVLMGVVLCVALGLAVWLLKVLLRKAVLGMEACGWLKTVDGALGTVLYFALGAVVCIALVAVCYVCTHYAWFDFTGFFEADTFADCLYRLCKTILPTYLPVF